ncbi:hypothetical protein [Haladaptatus sp. DYF46]|uniref:hypothetical protein n=1 Tax=Haladaptatus sp. DYF46 TaxID=2886041 RepID=UPI001E4238B1|nr:hypothetical protein [Haladaptatus sp. DYF46]
MSDDDTDAPLARVRRAKGRQAARSGIDGGAIAVGLVVALGAHLVPAFLVFVGVFDTLLNGSALLSTFAFPLGSYVTGRYAGGDSTRGGLHGLLTTGVSLALLGGAAALFVGPDHAPAELGRLLVADDATPVLAGTVVCLLLSGVVAGALGAKRV